MSLEVRDDGAMDPGKLLEQLLGGGAPVIVTLVCGDNYAVEHEEERIASVLEKVCAARVDLFVAGSCFEAGRYGMAAGALCVAVQSQLVIPAVTGMSEENPGVGLYRERFIWSIPAPTLQTAAKRLIDMLEAKVKREPFESEMLPTSFESVPMPSGVN